MASKLASAANSVSHAVGAHVGTVLRNAAPAARVQATSRWAKTPENFQNVLHWFTQNRATAVLRTPTAEAAPPAMQAAISGGFRNVEFTLTTPGCLDCVSNFRNQYDGQVLVGCGTIMDVEDAQNALEAGAEFIVSPILAPEVVKWCRERNVVCIPGCATPTELYQAYQYGAPIQKLFPGVMGGANWVRAVSAAMPMLNINPTSGVDIDNAHEFLKSGAAAVGLVAPLFDPADISAKNWDKIQAKAEKVIANVKTVGPLVRK